MGSYISYLWWGLQNPDEVNPVSGLSVRDIFYVRKSWTKVSADGVASGSELLIRYFKAHPEAKSFFKFFKDVPNDELRENRQFQAHCLNIITSLTMVIDNLHKPDLTIAMCDKLGKSHNFQKVSQQNFNDLKDVLVDLFINDLHFDEETMKSWVRTVTFIYTNIFKKIEKIS